MGRKISYSRGKGKLRHNNRDIISANVDKSRCADNITLVREDLGEAYRSVFGEAQEAYNAKQKRADRKIDDYFKKLFGREPRDTVLKNDNKQQSFYEYVVGVGDMRDTGFAGNPEMAQKAVEVLREYAEGFTERNPNFHVFNSVIHCDEATPHLHYDFIPFADGYKTGMSRQQGIAKALEQMGYGKGDKAIKNFTQTERNVFREICEKHGIEVAEEEKGRGETLTTKAYREYAETREKNENLKAENEKLSAEKETKLRETISDFVSGKGAKKVAAAEKIIENADALNAANIEKEKQLNHQEGVLNNYAKELDNKARRIAALQRETEGKAKELEAEKQALEANRKALEVEKKSFTKAVAIKARQIVEKLLKPLRIKLNRNDIDSQINLAVMQERRNKNEYNRNH